MSLSEPRLHAAVPQIERAAAEWNKKPGEVWDITVSVDKARLGQCLKVADTVLEDGPFPKSPGPFKLLASFALAVQYWSPYVWESGPRRQFSHEKVFWEPRLTVWTLPYLSEVMSLGGKEFSLPITFPTPHLQLEVLNYLRIVHRSKQSKGSIDTDQIVEETLLFGLCVEASAYASFPDTSRLHEFMKHAENCGYKNTDDRWPDQCFMDDAFYDMYFDAGRINVD